MELYMEERAIQIAIFIIDKNSTLRKAAKEFGVSKSTVHFDIVKRLNSFNPMLANDAIEVLKINKSERHVRGGMATKKIHESKTNLRNSNFRGNKSKNQKL